MIDLKTNRTQCYPLEVTTQEFKAFTRGIDSPQLQLLCGSSDSNIPLDDIQWTQILPKSFNLQNPFIVSTLSNGNHYFQCYRGSDTSFIYTIVVQGKHISSEIYVLMITLMNSISIFRISYSNDY